MSALKDMKKTWRAMEGHQVGNQARSLRGCLAKIAKTTTMHFLAGGNFVASVVNDMASADLVRIAMMPKAAWD